MSGLEHPDPRSDLVSFWNGLTKVQLWSLEIGEVNNLMDDAVEEIETLRSREVRLVGVLRDLYAENANLRNELGSAAQQLYGAGLSYQGGRASSAALRSEVAEAARVLLAEWDAQ